jgi:hypothetical protein
MYAKATQQPNDPCSGFDGLLVLDSSPQTPLQMVMYVRNPPRRRLTCRVSLKLRGAGFSLL